jgi:hypothetical protein
LFGNDDWVTDEGRVGHTGSGEGIVGRRWRALGVEDGMAIPPSSWPPRPCGRVALMRSRRGLVSCEESCWTAWPHGAVRVSRPCRTRRMPWRTGAMASRQVIESLVLAALTGSMQSHLRGSRHGVPGRMTLAAVCAREETPVAPPNVRAVEPSCRRNEYGTVGGLGECSGVRPGELEVCSRVLRNPTRRSRRHVSTLTP